MSDAAINVNAPSTSLSSCNISTGGPIGMAQGATLTGNTLQTSPNHFIIGDGKNTNFVFRVAKKYPNVRVFERTFEDDVEYESLSIDKNGFAGKKLEVLKPVNAYEWEVADNQLSITFETAPKRKQYVVVVE